MKGEVTIQVPVGVPILEASGTTTAEVKAGASIGGYHGTGSGDNERRSRLSLGDPEESPSHPSPTELVRGLTEVNLVAVIEEPAAYIAKTERRRFRNAIMKGKIYLSPAVDILHYKQIPDYKAVLFPSNATTIGLPPSGLAARTIPFDSTPISFAGFRLATMTTVRPMRASGE